MALAGKRNNLAFAFYFFLSFFVIGCNNSDAAKRNEMAAKGDTTAKAAVKADTPAVANIPAPPPTLDTAEYRRLMLHLAHDSASAKWPVKDPFPLPGALLPFNRIVAYYGNFYSKNMGILGELDPDTMLKKLHGEVKKWQEADSTIKVIPAIHYICVTAQGAPGKGGKYILRMPFAQIDKAIELAAKINAIVFLDVQVGLSTLQAEIPQLEKYLMMPNVHLAVDPEFSMKTGKRPGTVIGTFDAVDINYVVNYLGNIVKKNNLPPKILVIHRFTVGMMTNQDKITLTPQVQVVMDMDGWGFPAKKVNSYKLAVGTRPVQFTGFKLFYKNDIKTPPYKTIMTPKDVLKLYPQPIYIQYQ